MTSEWGALAAEHAAEAVRGPLALQGPAVAIILGSGLGGLADRLEARRAVSFHDIPGFPGASVIGHDGSLVAGTLDGREVIALAGRFHMYEGHGARLAAFPVRVLHALGARTLFVSNAAGGIRRTFVAGDLMVIEDHINLMWRNPLIGPLEPGERRFPDMSDPYDPDLRSLLREAALRAKVRVVEGVYAGLLGPTYETPSEVRMLERLGIDAVGMSTVPEVVVARALGMRVAGMSCIANLAAGMTSAPISHADVLAGSARAAVAFEAVVREFVRAL
jgi:purine-nucleoside phosphorylase